MNNRQPLNQSKATSVRLPFVLFVVRDGLYALGSEYVREIVLMPKVVAMPNVPPEVRGVINLRNKVMQLIDLRVKWGLPSAQEELAGLVQLLHEREQDHQNWLNELEACIREHRPFLLARDPHACKFGKWYDHFQTESSLLRMTLKKMDEPHKIIHATANAALQMEEQGNRQGALELLAERRSGELSVLVKLFAEARQELQESNRELAIVLGHGEKRSAISIDRIESVERILEENIEPLPGALMTAARQNWRIGKRTKTQQAILMPQAEDLVAA